MRRAAQLLAALADSQPDQPDLAKQGAERSDRRGQMELALSLARRSRRRKLPTDARLLLVAEEIRRAPAGPRAALADRTRRQWRPLVPARR